MFDGLHSYEDNKSSLLRVRETNMFRGLYSYVPSSKLKQPRPCFGLRAADFEQPIVTPLNLYTADAALTPTSSVDQAADCWSLPGGQRACCSAPNCSHHLTGTTTASQSSMPVTYRFPNTMFTLP